MFMQLPHWLYPMLGLMALGALVVLGLVLWRGDLCPGQRARITSQSFSIWMITALSLFLAVEAQASFWLIGIGTVAVIGGTALAAIQSRMEGKRSIASYWLWLPALPLALYGAGLLLSQSLLLGLSQLLLLGCAFAHLILLRARHRLQAFNLLLPLGGLLGAVVGLLGLGMLTLLQHDVALLDTLVPWVLTYALVMVAGLLIWFTPLLGRRDSAPAVLSVALALLLVAQCAAGNLFHLI